MLELSHLTRGQVLWLLHDQQALIPSYSVWLSGVLWTLSPTSKVIALGHIQLQHFLETDTYQVLMKTLEKPTVPEVISRAFTGAIEDCFTHPVDTTQPSIWFRNTNIIPNRAEFKNENLDFITYDPRTQHITAFIAVNSEPIGALGEIDDSTA